MKLDSIDRRARIELEARRMRAKVVNDFVARLLRRTPHPAARARTA